MQSPELDKSKTNQTFKTSTSLYYIKQNHIRLAACLAALTAGQHASIHLSINPWGTTLISLSQYIHISSYKSLFSSGSIAYANYDMHLTHANPLTVANSFN